MYNAGIYQENLTLRCSNKFPQIKMPGLDLRIIITSLHAFSRVTLKLIRIDRGREKYTTVNLLTSDKTNSVTGTLTI